MMGIVKKGLAVYLLGLALIVAVFFMITAFVPALFNSPGYSIWKILNWFMAASMVIIVVESILREMAISKTGDRSGHDRLEANLALAAGVLLTMWYFWNWFYSLNPAGEPGDLALEIHLWFWAFIDPLFVIMSGYVGIHLWRRSGSDW